MPTRVTFEAGMRALQDELLAMGDLVGSAIRSSVEALANRDSDLAHEIIDGDQQINDRYTAIEREALELIATQQPMATDLREILAVQSIATDLERIGDHAKGNAVIALRIIDEPPIKPLIDIPRMAEICREMLRDELQAFVEHDTELAQAVAERDNEIDALYDQIYRELVTYMMNDPQIISRATRLLWVAKSIERMGDHVTNIGERVVFLRTGRFVELNA